MSTAYEINAIYKPLYTSKKRYQGITGGRGSLKSHTVHDFVLRLTYEVGQGILFTRWTLTSAHTSIIPDFEAAIDRLGMRSDFIVTKTDIINIRTGAFIWFRGLKPQSGTQTSALKSLSRVTTWIVEEAEDLIDEKLFNKIDDSIRSKTIQNRIILILNPTTREHWIYQRWFKDSIKYIVVDGFKVAASSHPEMENIHSTYLIGLNYLNNDWLLKAERWRKMAKEGFDTTLKRELNEIEQKAAVKFYVNNYLGGWLEKAEGVIFENWIVGAFDNTHTIMHGLDYGYSPDPTAMSIFSIDWDRKKVYCKQLIYQCEMETEAIKKAVKFHVNSKDIVIADSADQRLNHELFNYNIPITKSIKGADSRRSSILQVLNFQLIIDPESLDFMNELNLYSYMDKKSGFPKDGNDHLIDGLRYVIQYFMAINGY